MNIYKIYAIFLCAIFSVGQAVSCEDKWLEFVSNPSQETYKKLSGIEHHSKKNNKTISEGTQKKLIDLINNKNKYAIDASFLLMPKLGGGNLEVMFTAVGNVIKDDPGYVLEMFKKHQVPLRAVNSILTMVPYTLIEDYEGRTRLIDERISAIELVNQKALQDVKQESLDILRDESDKMHKRLEMIRKMK